jgi:hypothetical protein
MNQVLHIGEENHLKKTFLNMDIMNPPHPDEHDIILQNIVIIQQQFPQKMTSCSLYILLHIGVEKTSFVVRIQFII